MPVHFLTFADARYSQSLERIRKEAMAMGVFESITCMDESQLDPQYWQQHHAFCRSTRGFGYWIWKSQATLQMLARLPENDLLFYCDAGCILNADGLPRFKEYMDMTYQHASGVLGFELQFFEAHWTKGDTLHALDYTKPNEVFTKQLVGGIYFIRNNPTTRSLVKQWRDACISCNYHLVDDTPGIHHPNDPGFRENRHDQSIWSILRKKHGALIIPDETYWHPHWDHHRHFPIHARRAFRS